MNSIDPKQAIENALQTFSTAPLREAATGLFECLGYRSQKRLDLKPNNGVSFLNTFAQNRPFNRDQAMVNDWQSVDFLFQLTDAEVQAGGQEHLAFESSGKYDGTVIQSYLFFAIRLAKERYTRTQISAITRSVNRLFDMPAMLLFLHGDMLTLSIIRRRLHKRDESRDVLEKVTLIKDIRFSDPIRAHIEILHDLCLPVLYQEFFFHNFVGLHLAWEKRLDSYALNERFYREIADWYFWALKYPSIIYPRSILGIDDEEEQEKHRSIFLIRLLTRLIFCWFLQEKGLLPRELFRRRFVERMLKDFSVEAGTYYRAFLQNLFFGTLNQEPEARGFRRYNEAGRDGNRGVTNLYRYRDLLKDSDAFVDRLREIPFVNGGLFDCLDQVFRNREGRPNVRLDDFSEERNNRLCLPNELFFGDERPVDLSDVYADSRRRKESVRGLIEILTRYKFTVEENTPLEQEIALDPELLGKVFENLLASYNEDTRTTARKATGSYYTPREIVGYMVDEALIAYLKSALDESNSPGAQGEEHLRRLFSLSPEWFENPFSPKDTAKFIEALDHAKILDPACGSGAFLMGALHRLVDVLQKLDPYNRRWKEQQLERAEADRQLANRMQDDENRTNALRDIEARIADIERSFDTRFHALDFGRKLFLIENCIYGVDIQPIACQIAKLRFFISLIVDQNLNPKDRNLGIRPLPNLETKIVAADTLIPIEKPQQHQFSLLDPVLRPLREQLERVRHDYFTARTPVTKVKCRKSDAELRKQITDLLRDNGMPAKTAKELAKWDPYDQNAHATFFDPDWMFGLSSIQRAMIATATEDKGKPKPATSDNESNGFDIVIGNPPYVRIQTLKQKDPKLVDFFKSRYESAKKGGMDMFTPKASSILLSPKS
jgi:adenine-specific DNA-methyltransferase